MLFRTAVCFLLTVCLLLVCSVRILLITAEPTYSKVAVQNSSVALNISKLRGTIFDCNGEPLTGTDKKIIAVATPTPEAILYLSSILTGEEKTYVTETLNQGKPAIIETERELLCSGITNIEVPVYGNSQKICCHLIGYTDSSSHGVSGLEKIFDDTLYSNQNITVRYTADATGKILAGIEPEVELHSEISQSGIMTTIDKNIQIIAENSAKDINCGAVIVSEAGTGKIRAMVSKPDFDPDNISEYLTSSESPLINRCLMSYNVGSVFKLCVAAAGIENGYCEFSNNCTGNVISGKNVFNCHKRSGHGTLNLKEAIAYSCNTYFYNYAFNIGAKNIYNTSSLFGFGYKKTLAEGLSTVGENITALSTLQNDNNALLNLSIGQGELLASPVTMLSLYEAIACGGTYYTQTVEEGYIAEGTFKPKSEKSVPTRAISKETADKLKDYLTSVIEIGTGTKAKPESISAAGKTATAQTGQKDKNGNYIEHSWFCGFFPVNEPRYIISVLIENAETSNISSSEVFKKTADSICGLKGIKD